MRGGLDASGGIAGAGAAADGTGGIDNWPAGGAGGALTTGGTNVGARAGLAPAAAGAAVFSRETSSSSRVTSVTSSVSRSERRISACTMTSMMYTDSAAMSASQNDTWNCRYAPMKKAAVTSAMAPLTMRSAMPLCFGIPCSLFSMLAMEE